MQNNMNQLHQLYVDCLDLSPTIIIATLLLTVFLKTIISKDNLLKVVILSLAISLTCLLNCYKSKDIRIIYLNAGILAFIALVGMTSIIGKVVLQIISRDGMRSISALLDNKEKVQGVILIAASVLFTLGLGIIYLSYSQFQALFASSVFYSSVLIILLALIFLFCIDKLLGRFIREQAIRRKLFHLGPILITPIVFSISQSMLVAILSAGFLAFLALEIIRYGFSLLKLTLKEKEQEQNTNKVHEFIGNLLKFYKWMQSFNQREKYFWFTHLFLILSLQLSYSVSLLYFIRGIGHIVLGMIAADGMAALVGKRLGRIKLYKGKTFEGMLAFIVTLYTSVRIIQLFYGPIGYPPFKLWVTCLACSCGQLLGGEADNILTLLVFYFSSYILI